MTDVTEILAAVAIMSAITYLTRAAPFLLFGRGGGSPGAPIMYLGRFFPPAIICGILVYCFKDVGFSAPQLWVPEAAAVASVVVLHLWKNNTMISIFGGTAVYMVFVQAVFRWT